MESVKKISSRVGEFVRCPICNGIMYFDQIDPLSQPFFKCASCECVIPVRHERDLP